MPTKSAAQKKLMQAAAHNPKFAKKSGVPVAVAKEYLDEDKHKGKHKEEKKHKGKK